MPHQPATGLPPTQPSACVPFPNHPSLPHLAASGGADREAWQWDGPWPGMECLLLLLLPGVLPTTCLPTHCEHPNPDAFYCLCPSLVVGFPSPPPPPYHPTTTPTQFRTLFDILGWRGVVAWGGWDLCDNNNITQELFFLTMDIGGQAVGTLPLIEHGRWGGCLLLLLPIVNSVWFQFLAGN